MESQRAQQQQKENKKQNPSASKVNQFERAPETFYENPWRHYGTGGDSPPDLSLTPQNILFLQQSIGNQAVGQIVQAKLRVGQPGDKYEQEADRVADEIMQMPEPETQPKPT